jgi:decaprenyl-phosphate phosphoribosyltransferase
LQYIKLLRLKHSVKNLLIFLPLVYSGNFFVHDKLIHSIAAFITFTLAASAVYVINDIKDRKLDKKHPKKKYRPIASGKISVESAWVFALILLIASMAMQLTINGVSIAGFVILAAYIGVNFLYSQWLKNIPIVDVAIIALGFILRVYYGGEVIGVEISQWLSMVILVFSLYLGFGKRQGEIKSGSAHTRSVNQYYTKEFLDKNMFVFLTLTIVFYALWVVEVSAIHKYLFWTLPLVIAIMTLYSFDVEKPGAENDPATILFADKVLFCFVVMYILAIIGIMYF